MRVAWSTGCQCLLCLGCPHTRPVWLVPLSCQEDGFYWWLVSAFQGCTVPWTARQGTIRAITAPRSCGLGGLAVT